METLPVDVNAIIGMVLGASVVLIPIGGFTFYWVGRGLMNAYFRLRAGAPMRGADDRELVGLKLRVSALEAELEKFRGEGLLPADASMIGRPIPKLRG